MMKKVISALIILIAGASTVAFLGPYLRQVKFDTTASLTASPTTYDCADGSCIGFIVRQVTPSGFSSYEGKLLFPYDTEIGKDQLQNQWAHLLNNGEKVICLEGLLHKYPVNTLRLFQSGHGGYRIQLTNYQEKACNTSSS